MTLTLVKSFTAYNESGLTISPAGGVNASTWSSGLDADSTPKDLWTGGALIGHRIYAALANYIAGTVANQRFMVEIPFPGDTDLHWLDPFWTTNVFRHGLALFTDDSNGYLVEYGQDGAKLWIYRVDAGVLTELWSYGATQSGYPNADPLRIYFNGSADAWTLPETGDPSLAAGYVGLVCDDGAGNIGLRVQETWTPSGDPVYVGEYTRNPIPGFASQYGWVSIPSLDIYQEFDTPQTDFSPTIIRRITGEVLIFTFSNTTAVLDVTSMSIGGVPAVSGNAINRSYFSGEVSQGALTTTVTLVPLRNHWGATRSVTWNVTLDNGASHALSGGLLMLPTRQTTGDAILINDDLNYEVDDAGHLKRDNTPETRDRLRIRGKRGRWIGNPNFGMRAPPKLTKNAQKALENNIREALQPLLDDGTYTDIRFGGFAVDRRGGIIGIAYMPVLASGRVLSLVAPLAGQGVL
ncbi:MAG: hypothetical protein KC503_17415 [Myxococcales bacterium]|nr:hypothetical protein [Myxococcales bacterium]